MNNRGGEVCINVKTGLQLKLCDDLSMFKEGIYESLFVELTGKGIVIYIGEIYPVAGTSF